MAIPFLPQVTPQLNPNALALDTAPLVRGIDAVTKAYTKQKQRNALASLDLQGVNPSLLAAAQTYDDPEKGLNVLAQGIMRKGDLEFEMAKLRRQHELALEQRKALMPLEQQQWEARSKIEFGRQRDLLVEKARQDQAQKAALARILGIDPGTPEPTPTPAAPPVGRYVAPMGPQVQHVNPDMDTREYPRAPGMTWNGTIAPSAVPLAPTQQTVAPTPPPSPGVQPPAPATGPTPLSPDQRRMAGIGIFTGNKPLVAEALKATEDAGRKKFAEASAKEEAETFKKLTDEAGKSRVTIATLDVLGRALNDPNVYTGPAGQTVLTLKRVADRMGIPTKGVPNTELALTVINRLTLGAAEQMKGALSDKDVAFLTTMVPSLASSKGGNAKIIGYLKKIEQRKVDIAQLAAAYVRTKGRLDAGFQDVLRQFSDRNPLFPVSGLSPEQVKALPPGTEWVHPNGTIMVRQ